MFMWHRWGHIEKECVFSIWLFVFHRFWLQEEFWKWRQEESVEMEKCRSYFCVTYCKQFSILAPNKANRSLRMHFNFRIFAARLQILWIWILQWFTCTNKASTFSLFVWIWNIRQQSSPAGNLLFVFWNTHAKINFPSVIFGKRHPFTCTQKAKTHKHISHLVIAFQQEFQCRSWRKMLFLFWVGKVVHQHKDKFDLLMPLLKRITMLLSHTVPEVKCKRLPATKHAFCFQKKVTEDTAVFYYYFF